MIPQLSRIKSLCRAALVLILLFISGSIASVSAKKDNEASVLRIWDGDHKGLKAQTWASPKDEKEIVSIMTIKKDSGISNSTALEWEAKGKFWKGFGLNWYGWYPGNGGDDISSYKNLVFWIKMEYKGGKKPPLNIFSVSLLSSTAAPKSRESSGGGKLSDYIDDLEDGQWREIVIPLEDLLGENNRDFDLTRVWEFRFGEWNMEGYDYTISFDNIGFDNRRTISLISLPENRPQEPLGDRLVSVTADVDLSVEGKTVSPFIYGVSFGEPKVMAEMGVTMRRQGGNTSSAYNWKTGSISLGADWYFLNKTQEGSETPDKNWWATIHRQNLRYKMESFVTMPMEWVAKDSTSVGFPGNLYPECTEFAPNDAKSKLAGNGKVYVKDSRGGLVLENGKPKTRDLRCDETYPTQNGTNVGLEYNVDLLKYCIKECGFGTAKKKTGIKYICLDNEPMLYISTHRDMIGKGFTYDEYWNRTKNYAELIKSVDPDVKIAAPAVWGWIAYIYSSGDLDYATKQNIGWDSAKFPDFTRYGPFCKDFMRRCKEYKETTGKNLIDIFDFHAYPMTSRLDNAAANKNNPDVMEFRCLDIRKFWDETYRDPYTWMGQETWVNGQIAYLPLFRKWMKETGWEVPIAIGEYSHLAGEGGLDISDAVAQAETFAAWARSGVEYALFWTGPAKHTPGYFAWKMFRNPDGKHTAVGDKFIAADVSSFSNVSVYVFKNTKKKIASFVILNKKAVLDTSLTIRLKSRLSAQTVIPYEFSRQNMKAIGELPKFQIEGNVIDLNVPAMSILRFDVKI